MHWSVQVRWQRLQHHLMSEKGSGHLNLKAIRICLQNAWRAEQLHQLVQDAALHCKTLEKTVAKSRHDAQEAQANLRALKA